MEKVVVALRVKNTNMPRANYYKKLKQPRRDTELQKLADKNPEKADKIMDKLGYTGKTSSREVKSKKKNGWLIDKISSVMSAPSRAVSAVKAKKGEKELAVKMMPKRYGRGTPLKIDKGQSAGEASNMYKGLRSRIRKGNYKGAREFSKNK